MARSPASVRDSKDAIKTNQMQIVNQPNFIFSVIASVMLPTSLLAEEAGHSRLAAKYPGGFVIWRHR